MVYSEISNVRIEAMAACVPKTVVRNIDFGRGLYGDKLESLINSTGMIERRVCGDEHITSLDLCVKAANEVFTNSSIRSRDIGAVVFVTLTPDALMPNNASAAQSLLHIPEHSACFDVNHACSGYIYGLWVSSLIVQSIKRPVLLLDGDTNSYYVSPTDKSTAILFGDAGTATILIPDSDSSCWSFDFKTEGEGRRLIQIPGIGFKTPLNEKSLVYHEYPDGSIRRDIDMEMDGAGVFMYVVNNVYSYLTAFMDELEVGPEDYAYAIFHQANAFMLRQLARKLSFRQDQVPMSMGKFGNTSSASIPLNICSEIGDQLNSSVPQRILMSGFGAGLAYGAVDMEIKDFQSMGVIEY